MKTKNIQWGIINLVFFSSIITFGFINVNVAGNNLPDKKDSLKQTNPQVDIKVNKQYDDKGNVISYDSTYTYVYTYPGDGIADINMDSIMSNFKPYFFDNSDDIFSKAFDDFFNNDPFINQQFFKDDFFEKQFNMHSDILNQMFQRMDSLKGQYFQYNFPQNQGMVPQSPVPQKAVPQQESEKNIQDNSKPQNKKNVNLDNVDTYSL